MLIDAGMVEGVGSRNGTIRFLRMTDPSPANIAAPANAAPEYIASRSGIITDASREVYRQHLGNGHIVWNHKANRGL